MTFEDIAVGAVMIACLGLPLVGTAAGLRRLRARLSNRCDEIAASGSVHTWDMPVMLATIFFGAGAVLGGVGGVPLLLWIFDGDAEAGRVFIVMMGVFVFFAAGAAAMVRPGLRVWSVSDAGVSRHGRSVVEIPFGDVRAIRQRRSLTGAVTIDGTEASITVPTQVNDYDVLIDRVRRGAPHAPFARASASREPSAATGTSERSWRVSTTRTRSIIGFLAVLLLFFVGWPWFVVSGESPVRDSFFFVGIGLVLWAIFAGLLAEESFQRDQPAELSVADGALRSRCFRSEPVVRPLRDIVTVTVEPDIIYVKGMPGHRTKLVVDCIDGGRVTVDDFRAKHLGASTHQIASAIRTAVFDDRRRRGVDVSDLVAEADAAPDTATEVLALQSAIATGTPDATARLLSRLGDVLRRDGQNVNAVHSYRAHLDLDPDDTDAWEGLIASYRALGRDDLAARVAETAERLHLRR